MLLVWAHQITSCDGNVQECLCLFRIPELGDRNSYAAAIEALPLVQTPEVFGLHANADISYYTSATKALWRSLVRQLTLHAYRQVTWLDQQLLCIVVLQHIVHTARLTAASARI